MTAAVLWDLDGTLADTVADIADTANDMLTAAGFAPLPRAQVRGFIGDGARSLVDRVVRAAGGEPTAAHVARFMAAYRARPCRTATLYPGIAALLAEVGAPQGVVTNKPEAVSRGLLGALGILETFGVLVGGDTLPHRKPHPGPVRAALAALECEGGVLVGDGPADVGAARAAGIRSIGVTWGIGDPAGADHLVTDPAELRELLADLGALRYR